LPFEEKNTLSNANAFYCTAPGYQQQARVWAIMSADTPSVPLSFANSFWGKRDAGVEPLLTRMHNAKQTLDECKAFYTGMLLFGRMLHNY
jgi:hypothetical protein